jgi:hypothetical protein
MLAGPGFLDAAAFPEISFGWMRNVIRWRGRPAAPADVMRVAPAGPGLAEPALSPMRVSS